MWGPAALAPHLGLVCCLRPRRAPAPAGPALPLGWGLACGGFPGKGVWRQSLKGTGALWRHGAGAGQDNVLTCPSGHQPARAEAAPCFTDQPGKPPFRSAAAGPTPPVGPGGHTGSPKPWKSEHRASVLASAPPRGQQQAPSGSAELASCLSLVTSAKRCAPPRAASGREASGLPVRGLCRTEGKRASEPPCRSRCRGENLVIWGTWVSTAFPVTQ